MLHSLSVAMAEPTDACLNHLEENTFILKLTVNTEKTVEAKQSFEFLTHGLELLEVYWQFFEGWHRSVCRANKALQRTHVYSVQDKYYKSEDAYVATRTELATRPSAIALDTSQTSSSSRGTSIQLLSQSQKLPHFQLPEFSKEQKD